MNKIIKKTRKKSRLGAIITQHVLNNKKDYIISLLLFVIGLIIGIIFINHLTETEFGEIGEYIKNFINTMTSIEKIDYMSLFKESILSNFILILAIWIAASTIIGIPIVYGILVFRGFVLGYTISSILVTLGIGNGIIFTFSSLLLHNLIFIPIILAASASARKLYQSIVKNKKKENVKIEFVRHTIFCIIMLMFLIISSIVEVYISTNLSKIAVSCIKI